MTHITIEKEKLELALEALEVATTPLAKDRQEVLRAITAIKDALARPEQQEPDDSLLLCASDLEHSAIYDNHSEMQSCIRAVALRIKALKATPQPAPVQQDADDISSERVDKEDKNVHEPEPVAGLTPSGYFIKGWDARGIHEKTSGSVESDRAMRHYMLGITDTTPPQPKEPKQEPVAWPTMPPSKDQSPILFEDGYAEGWAKCMSMCKAAFANIAPPQRKPLTPEQIAELDCLDHFKFARVIEAAYGIAGEA